MRTVVELVKNINYYDNLCGKIVGPCNEAIRRACNNYNFAELYEIVALASVLNCEVQSVYPYIDYRAEMKSMNAVYRPVGTRATSNMRLIIFWTSSQDEFSTRNRPSSGGVWSPNHFVPLIQPGNIHQTIEDWRNDTDKVINCILSSIAENRFCYDSYF